jgi:hypothetical protein
MAARKDLLGRLADAGEEAIGKLGKAPGIDQVARFAQSNRDRLDELTKRVRGVEQLEQRIETLEKRVDELTGTKSRSTRPRSTAAPKRTTSTPKESTTPNAGGKSPG